jgi:hypothetical protein
MGLDTNKLDTREEDKRRNEKTLNEEEVIKMDATETMEQIETIVKDWQVGEIDSEEALKRIKESTVYELVE